VDVVEKGDGARKVFACLSAHKWLYWFLAVEATSIIVTLALLAYEGLVFDYCVTHQCGVTGGPVWQKGVYILTQLLPILPVLYFGCSVLSDP
jgi:hypothetical protein